MKHLPIPARPARAFVALAPVLSAILVLAALYASGVPAQAAPNAQYPVQATPTRTTTPGAVPYPVAPTSTPVPAAPTETPQAAPPTATSVPATSTPLPTLTPAAAAPTLTPTGAPTAPAGISPTAVAPTKPPAPPATATVTAAPVPPTAMPATTSTRVATPASGQAAPSGPADVAPEPAAPEESGFQSGLRTVLTGLGTIWLICGALLFVLAALGIAYLFRGTRRRRE